MNYDTIASTKLGDLLKKHSAGEPVNVHVVSLPNEPKPDFDAMQKVVSGEAEKPDSAKEQDGERAK